MYYLLHVSISDLHSRNIKKNSPPKDKENRRELEKRMMQKVEKVNEGVKQRRRMREENCWKAQSLPPNQPDKLDLANDLS